MASFDRFRPRRRKGDFDPFASIEELPGYVRIEPRYRAGSLAALLDRLSLSLQNEIVLQHKLDLARAELIEAQWDLHEAVISIKRAVVEQYGIDSPEAAALGIEPGWDSELEEDDDNQPEA
ncbi:MAG TPA: hypothetical protein PKK15_19505 [Kouleothrix sp.]|uniref:hypothetical protein n=1 Tax=Kouleothrix sp. TaxID=2779161 RepID=UPI002C9A891F|nr:hypothetical protein [Kouleothrix sp.]